MIDADGVGYRNSKDVNDLVKPNRVAKCNVTVHAELDAAG